MAQNQRFTYEYKLISDSTNRADVKIEMMNLDVTKEGSRFYSYTVYHSDSTMKVDMEKQLEATGRINIKSGDRKGLVKYSVTKEYPQYKIFLHNKILRDQFKVLEERLMVWKMTNESQKIGIWKAQKATTTFGGRHWTAWFASEIPIQDGPYKFHGLPGLIVKLEDKTKSHVFELKGVRKFSDENVWKSFKDKERYESLIVLNDKKYRKTYLDNRADPNKGLRNLLAEGGKFEMKDASGKIIDSNQIMKDREKNQKEANKKNNNVLELDLLQ